MMKFKKTTWLFILSILVITACSKDDIIDDNTVDEKDDEKDKIEWSKIADKSSNALTDQFWNISDKYFNTDNGNNKSFQYWPQAHALDVLIDAYERTNRAEYKNYFDSWYEGVKYKNGNGFYNEFYDDMEWIALAMLRAYKATDDVKFKDAALEIWEYIKVGWNDNAGGGITWKRGMEYSKNACSNGPAAILAARLYQEFGDEENKEWALKIYGWLKNTLVSPNGMVFDNINSNTNEIKKEWVFTYNQGTYVGAAVELYKIFNERSYINDAVIAANYTISSLVDNSVLKSEGDGDGGLFKGIFVRYFTELIQQERLPKSDQTKYIQFLKYNAEVLLEKGTNNNLMLYGPSWWNKPNNTTGLTEQLSGSMLFEAVALLESKGFI